MNKQQLQQEIEALQKQLEEKQKTLAAMPDKWEPKGGDYWVNSWGQICFAEGISSKENRDFGAEHVTRQQAEKAVKAMRAHNRLLAYVAEFAPDYFFRTGYKNWHIFFDFTNGKWGHSHVAKYIIPGVVYMPERVAEELAAKLNSGEVEI